MYRCLRQHCVVFWLVLLSTSGPEMRGGRQSEDIIKRDADIRESISKHINRFPKIESHYCRASTSKQYLHSDLNLAKMYSMYSEECSEFEKKPSFSTYKRVFGEKNLAFHRPKKDMCSLCETYRTGGSEVEENLKIKYDHHIAEKDKIRKIKDELKVKSQVSSTLATASFDLQQVIHLPISNENAIFYKRRLAAFNLTMYDIASKNCHCFTWNEVQSKRGSNEVATAIYRGLKEYDEQGIKEVHLFSDGCSGQNKNSILPAMMLYTVENCKNIEQIHLRFFESFHGQSEGDSVHSTIGNAIKRAGNIYTPSQLIPIFRLARNPPYTVHEMQFDDFLDFKSLSQDLRILKIRKTDQEEELNWKDFMEICVEKNKEPNKTPYTIKFKVSHREDEYHTITLKRQKFTIKDYKLNKLNRGPLKVDLAKYTDLISLCSGDTPAIRLEDHKNFYIALPH